EDHLDVPLDPFKHALPPHNPCTWPQEKSPPRSLPAETGLPAVPLCLARPQNGPPRCGRPASSAVTGGTGTPYWPRWAFGRAAPGGTGTRRARALAAGTPLSGPASRGGRSDGQLREAPAPGGPGRSQPGRPSLEAGPWALLPSSPSMHPRPEAGSQRASRWIPQRWIHYRNWAQQASTGPSGPCLPGSQLLQGPAAPAPDILPEGEGGQAVGPIPVQVVRLVIGPEGTQPHRARQVDQVDMLPARARGLHLDSGRDHQLTGLLRPGSPRGPTS